jgi:3-oxoadipate enol-lactonase
MTDLLILGEERPASALVLIHAFPLTSRMYFDVVSALMELQSEHPVVLVDLPGFGDAAFEPHWTITTAMQDLHSRLESQNIRKCIIGGTSMGGYAAFAYSRLYASQVRGLVLSNTKAGADDEKAREAREAYALDVEQRGTAAVIERQLGALLAMDAPVENPHVVEEVRDIIEASEPASIAAALRAMAVREDSTDLLAAISCPTLVISSTEDTLIAPEVTKQIALGVRAASYELINGAGHISPMEAPDIWAALVGTFIGQLD